MRLEHLLETASHLNNHLLGLGRTVVDHRSGQFQEHVFRNIGGTGRHESRFSHQSIPQFPGYDSNHGISTSAG